MSAGATGMSGGADSPSSAQAAAMVRRWEDSGGTWQVVRSDAHGVTIDLITCDGGEVMEQVTAPRGPALAALLGGRMRSDD